MNLRHFDANDESMNGDIAINSTLSPYHDMSGKLTVKFSHLLSAHILSLTTADILLIRPKFEGLAAAESYCTTDYQPAILSMLVFCWKLQTAFHQSQLCSKAQKNLS